METITIIKELIAILCCLVFGFLVHFGLYGTAAGLFLFCFMVTTSTIAAELKQLNKIQGLK